MKAKFLVVAIVVLTTASFARPVRADLSDDAGWEEKVDSELLLLSRGDLGIAHQQLLGSSALSREQPLVVEFGAPPDTAFCTVRPTRAEQRACVINALKAAAERSQAGLRATLISRGIKTSDRVAGPRMETVWVSNRLAIWGADITPALLSSIAGRSEVSWVRLGQAVSLDETTVSSDAGEPDAWHLDLTGLRRVCQEEGACGQGVTVGIIDTGWDPSHPDLQHLDPCRGTSDYTDCWFDAIEGSHASPTPKDDPIKPHGTHVAGIIGGLKTGGAPMVKVVAARALTASSGWEIHLEMSAQWMLERGVDIVSNSWGSGSLGVNDFFRSSIQAWRNAGIVPVFSAGNKGQLGCGSVTSPGNLTEVRLSAAAVSSDGTRAFFSGIGPSPDDTAEPRPSIAAPGVGVWSTLPLWFDSDGYQPWSGTSMAAPNVAAMAAQVLSIRQDLELNELEDKILTASTPKPNETGCWSSTVDGHPVNSDYGFGLLNAVAVSEAIGPWTTGQIVGRITSAATGLPLSGSDWAMAEVGTPGGTPQLFSRTAVSDADGRFAITLLPGTYLVRASAFGYAASGVTQVIIPAGGGEIEINFVLNRLPFYKVCGTVFADDDPQGGIEVVVEKTPVMTTSEWGDGAWEMSLPTGHHTIVGRCERCLGDSKVVTVTADVVGVELRLWHISSYKAAAGSAEFEYPPAGATSLCSGDECRLFHEATLPWDLPYWESRGIINTIRTLYVTGYGYIATSGASDGETAEGYPLMGDSSPPSGLIAPFIDGSRLPDEIWVWSASSPERIVVFWQRVHTAGVLDRWDFEVILYRDGKIEFRYGDSSHRRPPPPDFGLEDLEGRRVSIRPSGVTFLPGSRVAWKMWRSPCRQFRVHLPLILRGG